DQVVAYINNGELSMGHGRALLGLKDTDQLIPVVTKIRKEKLNVRQVEKLIIQLNEKPAVQKKKKTKKDIILIERESMISKRQEKKKPKKDIFLLERESMLRERLGTAVTIQREKRKGKIEIEFYTDDDLERIIDELEN